MKERNDALPCGECGKATYRWSLLCSPECWDLFLARPKPKLKKAKAKR